MNLGNQLNSIVQSVIGALFIQGELAQLTYYAFEYIAKAIKDSKEEELQMSYPVGYSASKEQITVTQKYNKDELIGRYSELGNRQIAINGIYQLVTIIEGMLGDVIRAIVIKYPKKLNLRMTVTMGVILGASSLEEIHRHAIDSLLNDLSYKSPRDFAQSAQELLSINLLEFPAYHHYIETKACRDVYIHNSGIANQVYVTKAGSHARVANGQALPINDVYFLESYEQCLRLTEWVEVKLHDVWPSSEYEARKETIPKPR